MAKRSLNLEAQTPPKKVKDATPPIPLSPSEITSPNQSTVVNGVIASVSPVRPSKYFDGELTDGDTTIRFVGFRKQQQQLLHTLCQKQQPIRIQNCQIQFNKFSHQLEILLRNNTIIQSTDAEFHIPDIKTVGTRQIRLQDVPSLKEYDVVTVTATVITVNEPQKVSQGKMKQEVMIADETGTCAVHLWEEDVNMLIQGKTYLLNKLTIRTFMDTNHLAFFQVELQHKRLTTYKMLSNSPTFQLSRMRCI